MTRPLVSLVTPCCNGEAFLGRYFSCVLSQTYPRIEVVLVDDGSTDSTLAVAEAHRPALEARGYRLVCLRQEHAGQAAAVNRGLAAAAGEYIAWPDSDDLMRPDNVGRKARYLDEHPEAGFVCCQVALVDEGDPARVLAVRRVEDTGDPWLFDRLIRDKGAFCLDIAYLARLGALRRAGRPADRREPRRAESAASAAARVPVPVRLHRRAARLVRGPGGQPLEELLRRARAP